jgi:hypothetical protein
LNRAPRETACRSAAPAGVERTVARDPVAAVFRAQAVAGNQAVSQSLKRELAVQRSRHLENEADSVLSAGQLTPAPRAAGLQGSWHAPPGGRPLPAETRGRLESRFQRSLTDIRVHDNAEAASIAGDLGARALTSANNIFFGAGQYRPGSQTGDRLLAHEISHSIQQSKGVPGIQLQSTQAPQVDVKASEIIGMPAGSRLALAHALADMMDLIKSFVPELAGTLNAISGKTATVAVSDDDKVEARLDAPLKIPASGDSPERNIRDVKITLQRHAGLFDFTISGTEGDPGAESILHQEADLTAKRDGAAFILSAGTEPHLRITPASGPGNAASIEVFAAPQLVNVPDWAKGMAKRAFGERRKVLTLTPLADVRPGSAEERKAVDAAVKSTGVSPPPRQSLTAGVGVGFHRADLLLTTTWRYSFRPTRYGSLVETPLQVDLVYSPKSEVLGSISGGIGTSLSTLKIPINVRLYGGLAGGSVLGDPTAQGDRPVKSLFGPVIGASVGYERGWFRAEVRVQDMINLLSGPSVPGGFLQIGGAF